MELPSIITSNTHRMQRLHCMILVLVVSSSMAQRPMYAGSGPIGRPDLANRFKDPAADTSTATNLNNRFGETSTKANEPFLPIDALGDRNLVNRLNDWPREHRPFWLINAEAIEAQRNPNANRPVVQSTQETVVQSAQVGQVLGNRGNFDNVPDFIPSGFEEVVPVPARPTGQRPTFLASNNN